MEILKYKKMANGCYKIDITGYGDIQLHEETILKYELLLKKNITSILIQEIIDFDKTWDVYYAGLKLLKARFRSTKELKELLIRKEYPTNLVNDTIDKLIKQGYLDDRSFARGYINNQILTSSRGPLRIKKELLNKGVSIDIVNDEISAFTSDLQIEKIDKIIKIALKSNRNRGGNVLKNKIINDLVSSGYDISLINKVISDYEFDNNLEIAKKEYEKLLKKYERKYSGRELDYKIREKLYQKGLSYDEN